MTDASFEPGEEDVGAVTPTEVLARARRVGPDAEPRAGGGAEPGGATGTDSDSQDDRDGQPDSNTQPEREPEPWELPPPPPPAPRLNERSVDDVFVRLRELSLPQARAFLRAYRLIPRSELDLGGWAPGLATPVEPVDDVPSVDEIVKGRAVVREGAFREARANGVEVDSESLAQRARDAVVEALSQSSLRGGEIEEATEAAVVAGQDATLALTVRPWISDWRFQELVEPWVKAYSVVAEDAQTFDILGVMALALGVLAVFSFGLGRSNVTAADLPAVAFAALAVLCLVVRRRARRRPA